MAHTEMKTMLLSSLEELGLKQEAVLWQAEIEQVQEQARVEILVMGEFNHGKSSLINRIVAFYEAYGNSDRLMMAYYYQGSTYRDMNDAPRALKSFHQVILYHFLLASPF